MLPSSLIYTYNYDTELDRSTNEQQRGPLRRLSKVLLQGQQSFSSSPKLSPKQTTKSSFDAPETLDLGKRAKGVEEEKVGVMQGCQARPRCPILSPLRSRRPGRLPGFAGAYRHRTSPHTVHLCLGLGVVV